MLTVAELVRQAGLEVNAGLRANSGELLEQPVNRVAYDSRTIASGDLFVAISGQRYDGAEFADEAAQRGALAVVAETPAPPDFSVPWLKVADARAALAALAASAWGHPSADLVVVGTTGTNGKTTTTYLLEGVFEDAGYPCGRVSSVSYRVADEEESAARTTPEAPDLQALLRRMVERRCRACAMEVSSHALALQRVDGIRFSAAVFTNLTHDHLDFHGDMDSYFNAKRRLFEMVDETSPAVVNIDDPHGRQLAAAVKRPVTYAIDAAADVRPARMELSTEGIKLDLSTPRGALSLQSKLLGRSNTYNILAAAAAGAALDLPLRAIHGGIASLTHVPGRMQVVSGRDDAVTVVVDFAHTSDALRGLLETARALTRGRLVTVFGCGGDRDKAKRPLMGVVAGRLSDFVVVTSDNPRSEDPARIAADIAQGSAGGPAPYVTVLDRAAAITQAIRDAADGDVVVIAGKGHERYQECGGRYVPFDDMDVARQALAGRRAGMQAG